MIFSWSAKLCTDSRKIIMIDMVEVASIVVLAYGLGARPYIEST